MKYLASLLLVLLAFPITAVPSIVWLERLPSSAGTWRDWSEIPPTSFFEVPASKLGTAEAWLADTAFLAQEKSGLTYFGRPDFKCVAPALPYLIRAAYVNGGTGSFGLYWAGTALVVSHAALGSGGAPKRTALIACLRQTPSAVFSSLSGAR